ncbi:MAG: SLC13 family permease [Candidatus Bruticola sp.]
MSPTYHSPKFTHHIYNLFKLKDAHGQSLTTRWLRKLAITPSPSPAALAVQFVHKEMVFCLAAAAASIALFWTKPSLSDCRSYIDLRVLELLFSLMAAAAGLQRAGFFQYLAISIRHKCRSELVLTNLLVLLCFFSAMFITNDVALIVFVPFTLQVLRERTNSEIIFVIVIETIAANLGSMVTPLGNPQNIFLCSFYNLTLKQFFRLTIPWGLISLALIETSLLIKYKSKKTTVNYLAAEQTKINTLDKPLLVRYTLCLLLCLLTVAKIVSAHVCAVLILIWLIISDRHLLKSLDYILLLTFVCFFLFVGSIAQHDSVRLWISNFINGRELLAGAFASQIISNVPAAVMLAPFTKESTALILGVNLGGLGTLIASLASLISYRLYSHTPHADHKQYLQIFTWLNFLFLAVLLCLAYFLS